MLPLAKIADIKHIIDIGKNNGNVIKNRHPTINITPNRINIVLLLMILNDPQLSHLICFLFISLG